MPFAHLGKRIEAAYKEKHKAIGERWAKAKLFVNSMEEKLKSVNVVMDSGAFQAFRAGAPIPNVLPFQKRAADEGSSLPSSSKVPRTETIALTIRLRLIRELREAGFHPYLTSFLHPGMRSRSYGPPPEYANFPAKAVLRVDHLSS